MTDQIVTGSFKVRTSTNELGTESVVRHADFSNTQTMIDAIITVCKERIDHQTSATLSIHYHNYVEISFSPSIID